MIYVPRLNRDLLRQRATVKPRRAATAVPNTGLLEIAGFGHQDGVSSFQVAVKFLWRAAAE